MNKPKVGWGIFDPDKEITTETETLLKQLNSLSNGQRDALLARAIPRYLQIELGLDENSEPSNSQMVTCTQDISNTWFDILGKP